MSTPQFTITAQDVIARFDLKNMTVERTAQLEALLAGLVAVIDEVTIDWDDEPDPARVAAMEQGLLYLAHRVWNRDKSPFGVAGFDAAGGAVRILREDPDVQTFLRPWSNDEVPTAP